MFRMRSLVRHVGSDSIFVRWTSSESKPIFFDMIHSNNAARVRLWMALKKPGGMRDLVETRMVQYPDLQTQEFAAVNPLKKVPALIRTDGVTVFESNVILNYLEDKYSDVGPTFAPPTPEGRQAVELMCRIHDLYIASANCTAPGFSHSQGAMYLSFGWHGPARGMDLPTRASKIAEIWKQLNWLESQAASNGGPHLVGECLTLADLTWFPTCTFMEFMLPRFFGWPQPFDPMSGTPFPALAAWYTGLKAKPTFSSVHADIWGYWVQMEEAGQFAPIQDELKRDTSGLKFRYGMSQTVKLRYQEPPPAGKRTGRYVNRPDEGDVIDVHIPKDVVMHDGRELSPAATLESTGFELRKWPTKCTDFQNGEQVVKTYYAEMMELIKAASGAKRVFIFDHTVRESGNTNLNAEAGGSAAPVPRVHCDYTNEGAPKRLQQLAEEGIFSRVRERILTDSDVEELAAGRFAFINVWRSICNEYPVMQQPLAVCDVRSVPEKDVFLYEIIFPDRVGTNYSLKHSAEHSWHYFPRMNKHECLVFKVYDKKEEGPRFVFHTAFDDPSSPPKAPPRKSIEIRAIAFFDAPV